MSSRPSPAGEFDRVAELVERLAVLVDAGVAPVSAWRHVAAEEEDPDGTSSLPAILRPVVAGDTTGADLPDRIRAAAGGPARAAGERAADGTRDALLVVAAVWRVATVSGAPLAPALAALADTLRDLAQSERELEVALAGPRTTSRLVLALPPLGLLLGGALGLDTFGTLFGTPPGLACLVAGVALVAVAVRWNRGMLRTARRSEPAPGVAAELTALALGGGAPPERALSRVASALAECGLPDSGGSVERQLAFARRAGAPVGPLLRSEARASRRRARSDAQRRGVELATRLVLPLGLCVLPAFVLLGVAPVGIALLSSTASGW